MKKILIFQWFDCQDGIRRQELTDCINHNLAIGFDEVIIFNDSVEPAFFGQNVQNILSNSRITYRDYINILNDENNYGSFVVLTNTDIKLDRNILTLKEVAKEKILLAMSRYESNEKLTEFPWSSQDVWAARSQPIHKGVLHQCNIPLGVPGCELRFSEMLFNTGFMVFNPCLDIKNVHVHSNQNSHKDENRIYGAYLFTPACTLSDIKSGNSAIMPTPYYLTIINKLFTIQ